VKILLVLVIAFALVWLWVRHGRVANEHALGTVATELAGRPVAVRCQGFWSELLDINNRAGEVQFPDGHPANDTYLTRATCGALKHFRTASEHGELDCLESVDWSRWTVPVDFHTPCSDRARPAAQALLTLTHESMHLRGWADEAQAQCYAIQVVPWTVVRLGGTAAEGASVADFILALQAAMPAEYRSSACGAGGGLDLFPATPAFPAESTPQLPPPKLYGPALAR
jgi:hypothetical protein